MKDQFIPYELALKLKKLGFNEHCFAGYNDSKTLLIYYPNECFDGYCDIDHYIGYQSIDDVKAPLWQQAFDWFRKQGLRFSIIDDHSDGEKPYSFTTEHEYYYDVGTGNDWFTTYEEAREACLEKLIELCKKN